MARAFGIEFSPFSQRELVDVLANRPAPDGVGVRTIVTANVDHIARLRHDDAFRRAYKNAWVVTADGAPVFLYTRLKRAPPPSRLTGADLICALLPALPAGQCRCFFVADTAETALQLRDYLVRRGFAQSTIRFDVPPHGFDRDRVYSSQLADRIRAHRTTHLLFGVGAPKSEIWVNRHRHLLGDCYVLCVGSGLDFFAGTKRRAPVWMRRSGLEWLFRFVQEPRRLFRRYFIDSWRFIGAICADLSQQKR